MLAAQSPCTVPGHADRPSSLDGTRKIQFALCIGSNIADAKNLVLIGEMERICIIIVPAQNIAESDAADKRCNGSICAGNMDPAGQMRHGDLLLNLNKRPH